MLTSCMPVDAGRMSGHPDKVLIRHEVALVVGDVQIDTRVPIELAVHRVVALDVPSWWTAALPRPSENRRYWQQLPVLAEAHGSVAVAERDRAISSASMLVDTPSAVRAALSIR